MGRRQEEEERRRGPTWGSSGRRSFWPAALLAAAVLSSGFLVAQAQEIPIPIAVEPSQPLEGQDVTLIPGGVSNFVLCSWYRGEEAEANRIFQYFPSTSPPVQQNGPAFTGRETGGPGCSLRIRSLVRNDSGVYTVSKAVPTAPELGRASIGVSEKLLPPILWPADLFVEEHANVTLNCNTSESSSVDVFWFKDGNPVPGTSLLSERNRTLNIPDVSRNDAGMYTCQAWNPPNNTTSNPGKIAVTEKPFPPVLWPAELFVEEHANVTLNCTTSEHSGIAISWFKDGKAVPAKAVLSEGNRTLTVTDISRDDEGTYTCRAWNRVYTAISNPSKIAVRQFPSTLAAGAVSAIVLGSLAAAALAGTLLYCFFRARRWKNKSSKQMNPTSPVYENTGPSAQVVPVNSSETNHTYEELQQGSQAVYDQLRW